MNSRPHKNRLAKVQQVSPKTPSFGGRPWNTRRRISFPTVPNKIRAFLSYIWCENIFFISCPLNHPDLFTVYSEKHRERSFHGKPWIMTDCPPTYSSYLHPSDELKTKSDPGSRQRILIVLLCSRNARGRRSSGTTARDKCAVGNDKNLDGSSQLDQVEMMETNWEFENWCWIEILLTEYFKLEDNENIHLSLAMANFPKKTSINQNIYPPDNFKFKTIIVMNKHRLSVFQNSKVRSRCV